MHGVITNRIDVFVMSKHSSHMSSPFIQYSPFLSLLSSWWAARTGFYNVKMLLLLLGNHLIYIHK